MAERETMNKRRELEALLIKRTVDGLGAVETARVDTLLAELGDVDADQFERLAAVIVLASVAVDAEAMPARLSERIAAGAGELIPGSD